MTELHDGVAAGGEGVGEEGEHDNAVCGPDLPPLQLEEGLDDGMLQQVDLPRCYPDHTNIFILFTLRTMHFFTHFFTFLF